ncbi:Transcriptional regulatory protein ZraR [Pirellula sp. SH-Sr6A]|uniref:sigma 54-interacting transcriptional regulator n=1 Tax=Pirellula sp. SH-Sr6A TaxID=1632865 RepID=UPI00078CC29A|nr:sigma 54-interacting transcriptional regulator [Pirellula sp. SH-Sr6A]AMV35494.1 Transcriptional regulatory protein ZraR [Pirellula sp. SH-Sr6A]
MSLLTTGEWRAAEAIAGIGYANPFLPERVVLEKKALGKSFRGIPAFLQFRPECSAADLFPNLVALRDRCEQLVGKLRSKLLAGEEAGKREWEVYEDLVLYLLYARYMSHAIEVPASGFRCRPEDDILASYDSFANDFRYFFEFKRTKLSSLLDRDTLFAGLFQIERAFFHIFRHIVGVSPAAAQLRATVWQSIFTHDMRRYRQSLYKQMGDIPTLITGPSGTGKELVAQSIAYSRFIEFDARKKRFAADYSASFIGLNLSSISPTLIESELFGYVKGAFTGAHQDRKGFLDPAICSGYGTVLLDEIGELDTYLQVKLLRVLQSREFQRVGDTRSCKFIGKIIAATNRDLAEEMKEGRFREDFYYRLCADRIETPSLRIQLDEAPESIANFVRFIAVRIFPDTVDRTEQLVEQVVEWISRNLGSHYAWRGNFRELEQCVRSIVIRGNYLPVHDPFWQKRTPRTDFLSSVEKGSLDRERLLQGYFSLVYAQSGSYRAAGQRLGVDWRTVKEIVEKANLSQCNEQNG